MSSSTNSKETGYTAKLPPRQIKNLDLEINDCLLCSFTNPIMPCNGKLAPTLANGQKSSQIVLRINVCP